MAKYQAPFLFPNHPKIYFQKFSKVNRYEKTNFQKLAILGQSTLFGKLSFSVTRVFGLSGNSGRRPTCLKNSSRSSPVNLVWIFQGLTQFEISAQCNKSSIILIFSILKIIFCINFLEKSGIFFLAYFSCNTLYLRSRIFCRFIN